MSERTIEVISIHKGKIGTKVKGEPVTVLFENKGGVGVALCTHDEAAAFLKIGLPDFWKTKIDAGETKKVADPDVKIPTAAEHITLIKEALTAEAIEAVIAVEEALVTAGSIEEARKSVMAEAAKRSKALAAKE